MSFQVITPATLAEGLEALAGGGKKILAGGTDFMVLVAEGSLVPKEVINIASLAELRQIEETAEGIRIGAGVTIAEMLTSKLWRKAHRLLREAAQETGGPQIRNAATVGGNICTSSPAGDISAALLAAGAMVDIASWRGSRRVPLAEFFTGPKQNVLAKDELVTFIYVPYGTGKSVFSKAGKRSALIIATVNMGVYLQYNGTVDKVRIAVGSCAPIPKRLTACEEYLQGKCLTAEVIAAAQEILKQEISPITDLRATAEYRRQICANMLADNLCRLIKEVK